ncbi:MAG TPA: hypothetical protein PKH91_08055 [Flavobacterium sp.]|nr:hypothetical protein [Flavobacterium sp.]
MTWSWFIVLDFFIGIVSFLVLLGCFWKIKVARTVLEGTGTVLEGAGIDSEGTGTVLEGAGIILEGAGIDSEGAGTVLEGAGIVLESTNTIMKITYCLIIFLVIVFTPFSIVTK